MKKQSSIDWLIEEMGNKHSGAKVYFNANRELVEQAKEMHKEEIIEANMSARLEFSNSILTKPKVCKLSEQYYQKNFK
jgi:hypothetical protein